MVLWENIVCPLEYLEQIISDVQKENHCDLSQAINYLHETKNMYRNYTENMIDLRDFGDAWSTGLCITDSKGVIIYMNKVYADESGIDVINDMGKREDDLIINKYAMSAKVISSRQPITQAVDRPGAGVYVTALPIFDSKQVLKNVVIILNSENALYGHYTAVKKLSQQADGIQIVSSRNAQIFQPFLGKDKKIIAIQKLIHKIAPTDATVLITGESGCGKEVVADCIYKLSNRVNNPYIKINCAAIPATLLESELFGYEPGSFTGASTKGKLGLLEQADKGTILLDEIGDFPLELQPKLLRFLQQREIFRVGGSVPRKLDVRVIAATNSNLKQKIANGNFREDLFYRLNVIPITVPPLRERTNDIWLIANSFLKEYQEKYSRSVEVSSEVVGILKAYSWPGNVRELQNIMEYFVICYDNDTASSVEQLKSALNIENLPSKASSLPDIIDDYEKQIIIDTLKNCDSLYQAAKKLGVYPSSIYRKVKKYNIQTDLCKGH